MEAVYFILMGVAISYMLSGYYSLYHSQKILYSKYRAEYRENKWKKETEDVHEQKKIIE